jgi:phosphate transport system substrate-binding protein
MNPYIAKPILIVFFFFGCRQKLPEETPTSGYLKIVCDELVSPAIQVIKDDFQRNYPEAKLELKLGTTNFAIGSLLNNDVSCVISTRELDSIETDFLIRNNIRVFSQKLALDGVAILVNMKNPIEELNLNQLSKILTGETRIWNDVDSKLESDSIKLLIDGRKSGNYYLLQHQVLNHIPVTATATIIPGDSIISSSERILNYVAKNENSISYVSTCWLGNNPDFLKVSSRIKVIKLAGMDYHKAVLPIPGYVYRGDYPLRRMVYIMHRQQFIGLASGFTAYLTGNEGQRAFLEMNMVPAMNPIRLKKD